MELLRIDQIADDKSRAKILTLHPVIRQAAVDGFLAAVAALSGKNSLRVTYGLRTFEQQRLLLAKRPPVTKAGPGQSYHNYGLALDYVLISPDGKKVSYNLREDLDADGFADWRECADAFKAHGFAWGGDWNSFKDNPHVELIPFQIVDEAKQRGIRPWKVLLERHDAGKVDADGYVLI